MPLVCLVTDYRDVTVNTPTVHSVKKSVAPLPINPAWIGRFDPVRSVFLHPCFLLRPVGPYPGNRCIKTSWFGVKQYTHLAFKARFLFTFAYRIFNGFISSARTDSPQFYLYLSEPIGSLAGDRLQQILEASSYRHLLGCQCCIPTVCPCYVRYKFLSTLNFCSDPSACIQETAACLAIFSEPLICDVLPVTVIMTLFSSL